MSAAMTRPVDAQPWRFLRVAPGEDDVVTDRDVAIEHPVAIVLDGIDYAVLMATPCDLDDLAYGFLRAERIIDHAGEIVAIGIADDGDAATLRISLTSAAHRRAAWRTRNRPSDSACGLCGVSKLAHALRPLPPLTSPGKTDDAAIFRALSDLDGRQTLNRATGAAHAAARCGSDGAIRALREDVGRHNAFDKLIGAMLRDGAGWDGGFALLSSRCSYELVEKAVLAGCPMLVTISAPTSLALLRAREAGLPLRVLTRADALLASAG